MVFCLIFSGILISHIILAYQSKKILRLKNDVESLRKDIKSIESYNLNKIKECNFLIERLAKVQKELLKIKK